MLHISRMKRYIHDLVFNDLTKKMVIITGPRQVGKTFLCKQILHDFKNPAYLNYDSMDDLKIIKNRSWPLNTGLLAFDEIHKMKGWKQYLKGIYDTRLPAQAILVTGSSRLDTFRQSGESLAGRYFHYRLNPLSVKELSGIQPYEAVELLNRLGGFPEPFLSGSDDEAARWRRLYYSDIVREDILEFSRIHELKSIKLLIEMLRERVGSPLSFTSIAQDLQLSPNTVRKYIQILESLYIIFLVRPFHKNIARAILKEPKVYFYDSGYIKGGPGPRLENTCALCLLKYVQYLQDTKGADINLYYLKTKDGKEIDFVLGSEQALSHIIEVKLSDDSVSPVLKYFHQKIGQVKAVQLIHNIRNERYEDGIEIVSAGRWLSELSA
jgi:uncharacterized protein